MQNFTDIPSTRTLSDSLAEILNNDKTAISCSSGTAFPTTNLQLGMLCFRTDQNKLYILKATSPSAVWVEIMDVTASSGKAPNAEAVDGIDGSAVLLKASNLSDLANTATARTNLGIGNVENKSSATIRSEITSANVTSALGYAPQQQDSELTTLAQMSASRATFLASTNDFTFRNRIINGAFEVWQRGTSFALSAGVTTYTADRFYVNTSGGEGTVARVSGSGGFRYAMRITGASGVTGGFFGQKIEAANMADLAGGNFIGQIRLAASSNRTVTWYARYPTAEDNYAGVTAITSGTINVTTTPTNVTFSFSVPGAATTGLEIYFDFGALGAGATLDVTGYQLEPGSVATPFERRPFGTELALCQRYFYTIRNYMSQSAPYNAEATGANGWSTGGTICYRMKANHPVVMRATPTFTFANVELWDGNQVAVSSVLNNNSSIYCRSIDYNLVGNLAGIGRLTSEFVMPSGFIACSAEL